MLTSFPRSPRKVGRTLLSVFCLAASLLGASAATANERLIPVKDKNGNDTTLFEKVVVISSKATLSRTPTGEGEPIEPWAILFRIKNDDGSTGPQNGRLRVGDARGQPIGWIGQGDLKSWNTRFILDPIEPQRDRKFTVEVTGGGKAEQNATPEGKRRYALITSAPEAERGDDTEYPVVVYAGNVQGLSEGGTLSRQRNELRDVKLEIMFVIESSDFMVMKNKDDSKSLLDYVKENVFGVLGDIRTDKTLRDAIRVGFAEYKDSVPKASFTSRLSCPLTENYDLFERKLNEMSASNLHDDWPDDVLAGLNEAVFNAGWSENSVKHIVLLGMTSAQLHQKGANPPQSGRLSSLEQAIGSAGSRGHNSTGLSIPQLIARGRPQGGADSRARTSKMFHSFYFGRDIYSRVPAEDREELRKAVTEISGVLNDVSASDIRQIIRERSDLEDVIRLVYLIQVASHQHQLAVSQYSEIARNNGEAEGLYLQVDSNSAATKQAVNLLAEKIRGTFDILQKVRDGEGMPVDQGNQIAQPLFTLVGAAAEKFKDSPYIEGTSTVRDSRGREVAFKKVLVSEEELRRLKSTLDAMHTKFKEKSNKADRQDVTQILDDLKQVLAETSAGQDLGPNVKLKDLISDLPLKTPALDTTPADLALMTTEAFKDWLDRIDSAVFRIDDLLNSRQEWLTLSEHAVNDKFTFLRLSELP